MHRKIIVHGPSSLVVTLPSKWVNKNNLQKGDEVSIDENDNTLKISPILKTEVEKSIEIDFRGLNKKTIKDILIMLHSKGYDKIKILIDKINTVKSINIQINKANLGYQIINQFPNYIIIKSILDLNSKEFSNTLRKVFRITNEYFNKINSILNDDDDITENCYIHEESIKKLSGYCKRIMFKQNHKNTCHIYMILENLELIGHYLSEILNNIKDVNYNLSPEFSSYFNKIVKLYLPVYELYYAFSIQEYSLIKTKIEKKMDEIKKGKHKHSEDICSWEYLEVIAYEIYSLLKPILSVQY